jgi:hypothetical protein
MKPNWLLRFHGYHTFANYLNFHSTNLAIIKLCLFNYYNDTISLGELNPDHKRSCPLQQRSLAPTHCTTLKSPYQLSNSHLPKPKLGRLLTYTIVQLEQKPWKPKIKSTIQLDISLSTPPIMQLHLHMGN